MFEHSYLEFRSEPKSQKEQKRYKEFEQGVTSQLSHACTKIVVKCMHPSLLNVQVQRMPWLTNNVLRLLEVQDSPNNPLVDLVDYATY